MYQFDDDDDGPDDPGFTTPAGEADRVVMTVEQVDQQMAAAKDRIGVSVIDVADAFNREAARTLNRPGGATPTAIALGAMLTDLQREFVNAALVLRSSADEVRGVQVLGAMRTLKDRGPVPGQIAAGAAGVMTATDAMVAPYTRMVAMARVILGALGRGDEETAARVYGQLVLARTPPPPPVPTVYA